MKRINIAIDGYAGCGKSTLARNLAQALNYTFIDSGAMYRGIALLILRSGKSPAEIIATRPTVSFQDGSNHLILNGVDEESSIRQDGRVAEVVSDVAAEAVVRNYLSEVQRAMLIQKGVVMEGRDIGTVIMPGADLKLFITATLEARTNRRLSDLKERGEMATYESVSKNLVERDQKDASRIEAPLKMAEDAIALDTSHFDRIQQLNVALALARPIIDPDHFLPFIH
jgi:cytidylate kinase